eukprot:2712553-Rhodomonas_salina.1
MDSDSIENKKPHSRSESPAAGARGYASDTRHRFPTVPNGSQRFPTVPRKPGPSGDGLGESEARREGTDRLG